MLSHLFNFSQPPTILQFGDEEKKERKKKLKVNNGEW